MPTVYTLDASTLQTAFQTAITSIQSDVNGYLGVILPVALAIAGSILAIRLGMRFFKSLTK